jgi:hypothetical protein
MNLDGQAMVSGGGKNTLGLGWRETDAFAKDIDRIGEMLLGQGRDHRPAHRIDIAVGIASIFGWQRMCAKKAGHNP